MQAKHLYSKQQQTNVDYVNNDVEAPDLGTHRKLRKSAQTSWCSKDAQLR